MRIPAVTLTVLVLFGGSSQFAMSQRVATWPDPVAADVLPYGMAGLTHGPVLGQPTANSMKVWIRTREPVDFDVLYDTRLPLDENAPAVAGRTDAQRDNTGVVELAGLEAGTRYYYGVRIGGQLADIRVDFRDPWPSFRTLPTKRPAATR